MKLVLPLPDAPMRNTNSPGSIVSEISLRIDRSPYESVILWNCIDYLGKILSPNDLLAVWRSASVTMILTVCLVPTTRSADDTGNTNISPLVAVWITLSSSVTVISHTVVAILVWNLRLNVSPAYILRDELLGLIIVIDGVNLGPLLLPVDVSSIGMISVPGRDARISVYL